MKKTVRLLLFGVPTVGLDTQAWRSKATFKVAGKKPKVDLSKKFESFKPGLTNALRKRVVKSLNNSVELLRRDITAEVDDGGELYYNAPRKFEGDTGLDEDEMMFLCEALRGSIANYDAVMIIGGDHAGGMILYALDGKVCRFDQHSDSCAKPLECPAGEVSRNTYVCAAIRRRLKKAADIVGVGVREGESAYPIEAVCSDAKIIDIDLDVIAPKYGIKTDYNKGVLSPDILVGAVRKCSPFGLGVFEVIDGDENAAAQNPVEVKF